MAAMLLVQKLERTLNKQSGGKKMERSNSEQFLRKSRTGLVSLVVLAALAVPAPSGCELEKDENSSSGDGDYDNQSPSQYVCDCKGNGFYAGMEITAYSIGSANTLTTKQCQQDYPDVDCHCSCKNKYSSTSSTGSKYPSCSEVPKGYDGVCVNDNW